MLKVVDSERLIARYARHFAQSFRAFTDEKVKVKLGHQGASFGAKVLWSKRLRIWSFCQTVSGARYGNAFGTNRPAPGRDLPITAEINFPWSGIDRKTGGAFATDAWGRVFAVHRGKIGGGKKGIGKSLFEETYRGLWTWMEDGDTLARVAVIGALQNPRFAMQTSLFIRKIGCLKSAVLCDVQTSLNFSEVSFREDLIGVPPSAPTFDVAAACDRDVVVSQLAFLLSRWKYKIGNNADCELFLMHPQTRAVTHVIAVSDGASETSIYATATRLMLQRTADIHAPLAVMLLPEDKMNQYVQPLQRIGIMALAYGLEKERIVFPGLEKIRLDQNIQI